MFWPVQRKGKVFVVSPKPGPHTKANCIPLHVLLRDYLSLAQNTKEVKKILNAESVLVDKKVRKNHTFPTGLMDVIELPAMKQYFRVFINKRGLTLNEIKEEETKTKQCRIQGKRTVKGGKEALTLHDGRTILSNKKTSYNVGDTLTISLPDQKIQNHIKLETGSQAIIFAGRNKGTIGTIKTVKNRDNALVRSTIIIETKKGVIETPKEYVMAGSFSKT